MSTEETSQPQAGPEQPPFAQNQRLILKIDRDATYESPDGTTEKSRLSGELYFVITSVEPERMLFDPNHYGLVGVGVREAPEPSGRVSFQHMKDSGMIFWNESQWEISLASATTFLSELMVRELGFKQTSEDRFDTPRAHWRAKLSGALAPGGGRDDEGDWHIATGSLQLESEGDLSRIRRIDINLDDAPLFFLPLRSAAPNMALLTRSAPCHPDLVPRTLNVRRYGFPVGGVSTASAAQANTVVAEAVAVWAQCCVSLVEQTPTTLPASPLATSDLAMDQQRTDLYALAAETVVGVVALIFVDNELTTPHGGGVFNGDTGLAKVAVSCKQINKDRVLAHEMGHVLSGLHPDELFAEDNQWFGASDTVLEPEAVNPTVTLNNCMSVYNPAFPPVS